MIQPPPMAAADEVLEDEPAARPEQLVGAERVADRGAWSLGVEAAQDERPELHLAAFHVRQCAAGVLDGASGTPVWRQSARAQDAAGAARVESNRASGGSSTPIQVRCRSRNQWRFRYRVAGADDRHRTSYPDSSTSPRSRMKDLPHRWS